MGKDYTTSPYLQDNSAFGTISNLRAEGYDVKEENDRFYVNGVEVYRTEPLWEAEKRIKAAKLSETPSNMAAMYNQEYEKVVEEIKETKKKDNFFKKKWHDAKYACTSLLRKNNAKKINDIKDASDRALAIEYHSNETDYYALHRRASNGIFSLGIDGVGYALKGGEWASQELYAKQIANA